MAVCLAPRRFVLPAVRSLATVHVDALIVAGSVGLALAVRWPHLLLSPQFPSVGGTVLLALDVSEGRAFPLADQAPYLGAVLVYLLAAAYKLLGPSIEVTMLLPWALGGLTVVPTYLLGRELGGRLTGALAAMLLATSAAHTVISSHVPLVHSLTPLCAATTLWLLARAARRHEGSSMAWAGLGVGITLQTHPTAAPLLAGAVVAVLLSRRAWLRTRWPYLALALAALGYGPLLVHHLQTHFAVVADVRSKQARYLDADTDAGEHAERGVYANNLEKLSVSLVRLSSGALDERELESEDLLHPQVLAYPLLGLAGLALAARQERGQLGLALLAAVLLPPLFNGKYRPILDGRYLMPLVPVIFVGIGLAFAGAARALRPGILRAATTGVLGLFGIALVLAPLTPLTDFYQESLEDGFSNRRYLRTSDQLRADRQRGEPIVLDERLATVKSAGGGNARMSFLFLLALSRLPTEPWRVEDGSQGLVGRLAVLHRDSARRLKDEVQLTPLDNAKQRDHEDEPSYRPYRISAQEPRVTAGSADQDSL